MAELLLVAAVWFGFQSIRAFIGLHAARWTPRPDYGLAFVLAAMSVFSAIACRIAMAAQGVNG